MRETLTKPRLLILVASLALSVALLVAAKAQASESGAEASDSSFDHRPPDTVLMKGNTAIQRDLEGSFCWSWWGGKSDGWKEVCLDNFDWTFPPAAQSKVKAGSRLHIRIDKPERPQWPHYLKVDAYKRFDKEKGYPTGKKRLNSTLKPVKRGDDTVAWDIFFRVNEPNRNYYLDIWPHWKEVPGTHVSSGDSDYTFHVKTKAKGD